MSNKDVGGSGGDPSAPEQGATGNGGRPTGGPIVAGLEAVRRFIDKVLIIICVVLFTALVVVVSWQVFSRLVLPTPATWTVEVARYTFVVLALLSAALVFSQRGHIAVEVLVNKFNEKLQLVVGVFVEATIMFFAVYVLIYGGYEVATTAWNLDVSTMPVSVGQIYLVLPVAGVLITFFSICHVVGMFAGTEEAMPEIDENLQGI
ncbi:TRAP transporter small permease [Georgenia subflava]|uniref:TRAP transporter small permease subunit n=1 Tax=Georgenia subflava TaxID=1622177 RepID=A0A6N7ELZ6_9MICO|nr:TRAP transporter small permease [Georgenia subflava]MPV37555.1 TRAP transporter small permease subunit [Georgenia subflava]